MKQKPETSWRERVWLLLLPSQRFSAAERSDSRPKARSAARLVTALTVLFAFSACVNLQRSYPDKHFFALEAAQVEKPANPGGNGILEVANLSISRRYEGLNFVYRTSDTGYEADFYNNFFIAPAVMISEEVRKSIARSHIFAQVIGPFSDLPPSHHLAGIINTLYGDFSSPSPKAVLEIQFILTQPANPENQIVLAKTYSQAAPITARTPEALVKGWDQALTQILSSLIADIDAAKPTAVQNPPPPVQSPATSPGSVQAPTPDQVNGKLSSAPGAGQAD